MHDTAMRKTNPKEDGATKIDIVNTKQIETSSPRSTVDKKDDAIVNELGVGVDSGDATEDAKMVDAFEAVKSKPKRKSFSAISIAKSRRQIFPVTIPGVDPNGSQPAHPVPSHPSHLQSVQISVAAQWASGRTEMWPLQILDLSDRNRSRAARMQQPGAAPAAHNPARRHLGNNASYQHRPQPSSQASAVRPPVGYSPAVTNASRPVAPRLANNASSRPVAPRPVNASVASHQQQHRSPPVVAAVTAQAYIPPQTSNTTKSKKNEKQKSANKK
mmetsp:Transcript_6440/g.15306  ORF Transcript_6440/g.15306 Transcript_6440/m.15306 type:complete len:273 (-) Transcript_6440:158-976(-)